ncbi:MAG: MFS transporter [Acidobacteria bacterium]|nr:MFS transporter [Acidobacteriota bacterium]
MRELLRNRNAQIYLTGQTVSAFGDSALWLVAGVWVAQLTGSIGLAGLTFFFIAAPAIAAPLAGLLIDRLPRRPLLLVGNLASAAVVLLLLLVHSPGDVWLIYLVMILYGMSNVLLTSAQSALLPSLVPPHQFGRANALLRSAREALRLIAPPVGTFAFVALGGGIVAAIDAGTFVVAAVALLLLHPSESERSPAVREKLLQELAAGFRHVRWNGPIRRTTLALAVIFLVIGFLDSAGLALLTSGLHRPVAFIGVVQAAQGVGAIAGGLTVLRILPKAGEIALVSLGTVALSVGCGIWVLPPTLITVFVGAVFIGAGLPWLIVGYETLVQLETPDRLLGRTFGAVEVSITLPQTASIAIGAALIGSVPYVIPIAAVAIVAIGSGCLLFLARHSSE